jgi:predicted enzyme related to lactoylglutathione lyase
MHTIAYFEIQASSPKELVAFYQDVFGWSFKKDDHIPIDYFRTTNTEGVMGAILQRPAKTPPTEYGTNAYTCSMQVGSFDATAEKIMAAGGKVAMPKFAVPGRCWQGYFIDTDNNVFGIFEADDNAK